MKTIAAVYDSHEKAIAALLELKKSGFPTTQLSLLGKAELKGKHIYVKANDTPEKVEMSIGIIAGTILGILTGVGIFAVPGVGILFGAGAILGAFAGLQGGIIAGGIAVILSTNVGMDEADAIRYEQHLNEGKFIIFAQGDEPQLKLAQQILHAHGLAIEISPT